MPKIEIQLTNEQFLALERYSEFKGFSSISDFLVAVSDVMLEIDRLSAKEYLDLHNIVQSRWAAYRNSSND